MHECADDRYLPPLEVVAASDHDIVVNGLQSLIAGLRHDLAEIREKPFRGGPLPIGMRRTRAVISAHEGGKYTVRCGCGAIFERGRSSLLSNEFWRCMSCYRSQTSKKKAP